MADTIADIKHILESQEETWGPEHIKVASTLSALADLLVAEKKYLDAEPLLWRILEIRHKTTGQTNLEVAATLVDLSRLQDLLGNQPEAERLLRWSLDIKRNLLGAVHPEYTSGLGELSDLLVRQGKDPYVEQDAPQTQAPITAVPRADVFCWDHHYQRGTALLEEEEYLAAEVLFDCLVTITEHFAPNTIHHARCLDNLGRARFQQGRYPESLMHFKTALDIFEKTVGNRHQDTVECIEAMADVHAAADEFEEARYLYNWAQAISKKEGHFDCFGRVKEKLQALPFASTASSSLKESIMKAAEAKPLEAKPSKKKTAGVEILAQPPVPEPTGGIDTYLADLALPKKKTSANLKKPKLDKLLEATQQEFTPADSATEIVAQAQSTSKLSTSLPKPQGLIPQAPKSASINDLLADLALPKKKTTNTFTKPIISEQALAQLKAQPQTPELEQAEPPKAPKKRTSTTGTVKKPAQAEPPVEKPAFDRSRFDVPISQRKKEEQPEPEAGPARKKTSSTLRKPHMESLAALLGDLSPVPTKPEEQRKEESQPAKEEQAAPAAEKKLSESDLAEMALFGNMTDRLPHEVEPAPKDITPPRKKTSAGLKKPHLDQSEPLEEKPSAGSVGDESSEKKTAFQPLSQDPESQEAELNLFGNMTDGGRAPQGPKLIQNDPLNPSADFKGVSDQVRPSKEPSAWEKISAEGKSRRSTFKPWQKPTSSPAQRVVGGQEDEGAAGTAPHYMEIFEDKLSSFLFDKYKTSGLRFLQERNYREAERMYLLALEKAEAFGPRDPRLWQTQCTLGSIYESEKKFGMAEDLYKKSLSMCEKVLGVEHPDVAKYLQYLAKMHAAQDHWEESEREYTKAISILKKAGGSFEEIAALMRGLEYAQQRGKSR